MAKEKIEKKNNKFKSVYIVVAMFAIVIVVALCIALNNIGLLNFESVSKPKQNF